MGIYICSKISIIEDFLRRNPLDQLPHGGKYSLWSGARHQGFGSRLLTYLCPVFISFPSPFLLPHAVP
jgi:hypothetical protein